MSFKWFVKDDKCEILGDYYFVRTFRSVHVEFKGVLERIIL